MSAALSKKNEAVLTFIKSLVDQAAEHYDTATAHDNTRNLTGAILFYTLSAQALTVAKHASTSLLPSGAGIKLAKAKVNEHVEHAARKTDWCNADDIKCNIVSILNKNLLPKIRQLQDILKSKRGAEVLPQSDKDDVPEADCLAFMDPQPRGPRDITFDDVAGQEVAKEKISNGFIAPLITPRLYPKMTRGILLYGPPGTGKTLLAKACITELNSNDSVEALFFNKKAGDLKSKYVGESEKNIQKMFRCAAIQACQRQQKIYESIDPMSGVAPKRVISVIFLDEIEALAESRGLGGENSTSKTTVQALLVEMDGISSYKNVVVIGATNLREQLDPAILRRFEEQVEVTLPTQAALSKQLSDMVIKTTTEAAKALPNYLQRDCGFYLGNASRSLTTEKEEDLPSSQPAEVQSQWVSDMLHLQRQFLHFDDLAKRMAEAKFSGSDAANVVNKAYNEAARHATNFNSFLLTPVSYQKIEKVLADVSTKAQVSSLPDSTKNDSAIILQQPKPKPRSAIEFKILDKMVADFQAGSDVVRLLLSDGQSEGLVRYLRQPSEQFNERVQSHPNNQQLQKLRNVFLQSETKSKSDLLAGIDRDSVAADIELLIRSAAIGTASNISETVLAICSSETKTLQLIQAYNRQQLYPLKPHPVYAWTIKANANAPKEFGELNGKYVNRSYIPISSTDAYDAYVHVDEIVEAYNKEDPAARTEALAPFIASPEPKRKPLELVVMRKEVLATLLTEEQMKNIHGTLADVAKFLADKKVIDPKKSITIVENLLTLDPSQVTALQNALAPVNGAEPTIMVLNENGSPVEQKVKDLVRKLTNGRKRFVQFFLIKRRLESAPWVYRAFGKLRRVRGIEWFLKFRGGDVGKGTMDAAGKATTEDGTFFVVDTEGRAISHPMKRETIEDANFDGLDFVFDNPLAIFEKGEPKKLFEVSPQLSSPSMGTSKEMYDKYERAIRAIMANWRTEDSNVGLVDLYKRWRQTWNYKAQTSKTDDDAAKFAEHLPTSKFLRRFVEERAVNMAMDDDDFEKAIEEHKESVKLRHESTKSSAKKDK